MPSSKPESNTPTPAELRPPSAFLLMLEARAFWELGAMVAATPWLRRLPRGDGHPVLVFPGMGANDFTTVPLRNFLNGLGYVTQAWGQGFNFGPRDGVLKKCAADVRALSERHGQPVSLIGWSLGGIYAREMAKELPQHTRGVITLGTPFTGHPRATNAWRIFEMLSGQSADDPAMIERLRTPPPVPTTSIYSRSDGVVNWQTCCLRPSDTAENIEIYLASHVGLGVNPAALWAVADRLAQGEGHFSQFNRKGPFAIAYAPLDHAQST